MDYRGFFVIFSYVASRYSRPNAAAIFYLSRNECLCYDYMRLLATSGFAMLKLSIINRGGCRWKKR